ncbi:MAG: YfgM family protein [Vibrionaceae bacterium]
MDIHSTEEQQVEVIKSWWRDNGKAVALGALIGLAGLYGWRFYENRIQQSSEQASHQYNQLSGALAQGSDDTQSHESFITDDHHSAYPQLLALQLAKKQVDAGQLEEAEKTLARVVQSEHEPLAALASLRLARLHVARAKLDDALALLDKNKAENWQAQVQELRGDIKLQQGDVAAAKAAYAAANAIKQDENLQIKLDNLA